MLPRLRKQWHLINSLSGPTQTTSVSEFGKYLNLKLTNTTRRFSHLTVRMLQNRPVRKLRNPPPPNRIFLLCLSASSSGTFHRGASNSVTQGGVGMEQLYSPRETASLLKLSLKTLYDRRWRRQWGLRSLRIGRSLRFRRSEIERFLENQEEASPDQL